MSATTTTPDPFIVTQQHRGEGRCGCGQSIRPEAPIRNVCDLCAAFRTKPYVYREAFATLEEATRRAAKLIGDLARSGAVKEITRIDGFRRGEPGTATLPNGDVIEVSPTRGGAATERAAAKSPKAQRVLLAAWNAEHGIGTERGGDR